MAQYPALLPEDARFAAGIEAVLNESGLARGKIEVLEREPNLSRSTVPCEVVLCQEENGRQHRLFCKFGAVDESPDPNHRLGVAYEAGVYERVLRDSRATLPRYYGNFTDTATGAICLILECVDALVPVRLWPDPPAALPLAAQWLAQFHAEQEACSPARYAPPLVRYDAAYYSGWARRAAEFSRSLHHQYAWLPQLCQRAEDLFQHLLRAPMTVIHGECYSTNWLVGAERVMAIDWESAALAAGAIDVASLGWGWNDDETLACTRAYQHARWPQGAPPEFATQLTAAQIYLALRWLGDCPEWTTAMNPETFAELKRVGEEAGLL